MTCIRTILRVIVMSCAWVAALPAQSAEEGEDAPPKAADWRWGPIEFFDPFDACLGDCAVAVYGGAYVESSMKRIFGLRSWLPLTGASYRQSGLIAAAASRKIASYPGWLDLELEAGAAARFGEAESPEVWGALYGRWTAFPWNDYLETTVAVSTGLSYALNDDGLEVEQTDTGEGQKLMHFLSPEITFALPSVPDKQLLFRFHHRSGGRDFLLGENALFGDASGGAQYLTAGMRFKF